MTQTFIERHGYVQYSGIKQRIGGANQYPRPRLCEVCGTESAWLDPPSALFPFYVFDHCHTHGWVRGVLCMPCNTQMGFVDRGELRDARLEAHRLTCPHCAEPDAPHPPQKPKRCRRCRGCGVIWIPCLIRMVQCPDCAGTATHRDIPAWEGVLRTVTRIARRGSAGEPVVSRSVFNAAGARTHHEQTVATGGPCAHSEWDNWDILGQALDGMATLCDRADVTQCKQRSVAGACSKIHNGP